MAKDSAQVLSEQVYAALRERILRMVYPPGFHLVEAELIADLGVSRSTVREALRRLLNDELVELVPHRGIRVRRLSPRDIEELYLVREPLESLAARLAAQQPDDATAELWAIHDEATAANQARDRLRYMRLNTRLHQALAEVTGNRTLIGVLKRLNTQMIGYQFLSAMDAVNMATSQRQHTEILAAIAARDGERAEAAMRRHVQSSREAILAAIAAESALDATG